MPKSPSSGRSSPRRARGRRRYCATRGFTPEYTALVAIEHRPRPSLAPKRSRVTWCNYAHACPVLPSSPCHCSGLWCCIYLYLIRVPRNQRGETRARIRPHRPRSNVGALRRVLNQTTRRKLLWRCVVPTSDQHHFAHPRSDFPVTTRHHHQIEFCNLSRRRIHSRY